MKIINGKQSVELITGGREWERGTLYFCTNGYQRTGIALTLEQFYMLKDLLDSSEVNEFYRSTQKKDYLVYGGK